MNIALFGYILALVTVVYFIIGLIATFYTYTKLPPYLQDKYVNSINHKPFIAFAISIIYIITYHIS